MNIREKKYKAWDKEKKLMSKPFYLYELEGYEGEVNAVILNQDNKQWTIAVNKEPDENVVVLDWTGQKDRNRKEIYEGDILQPKEDMPGIGTDYHVVRWCDAVEGFSGIYEPYFSEVVGNIYENEDLIK